jgi:hypothetical protein
MAAAPIENVLTGRPAAFSWRELLSAAPPTPGDLRKFIEATPVLDFNSLEPGKRGTDAIRSAAAGLDLGVAFKIYFMMAWRSGRTKLLQSSLTRAVIFSAMTTATAFGSLWFSSHPGTSSMGKLLALSLACTLAAAVLFQPALMGKPRTVSDV